MDYQQKSPQKPLIKKKKRLKYCPKGSHYFLNGPDNNTVSISVTITFSSETRIQDSLDIYLIPNRKYMVFILTFKMYLVILNDLIPEFLFH